MEQSDVIVVGSGVAGLSFAIELAIQRPDLTINIFTKNTIIDSNSNYAQGGIATVVDLLHDSFEAHSADTLKSGGGLSNPKVVDFVVRSGPERIKELAAYGAHFNKKQNLDYDLALEGGHSKPRVVHSFDHTGSEIIRSLVEKIKEFSTVTIHEHSLCFDLHKTIDGEVAGVRILNAATKTIHDYLSKVVILTTGGAGQIFKHTTNPTVATGDGLALGIKNGAQTSNLSYYQFHPTAFVETEKKQSFLISEAVRGFGAYIVNSEGHRFLFNFDKRGELATRDIVSKAIFSEIRQTNVKHVYMDCRHLDLKTFASKFPMIFEYLSDHGIDLKTDLIPVVPAAHYQCGGLKVDLQAQTSVPGLFAIGEIAETGLHGANRLASNSLLEALVFAHEAANYLKENIANYSFEGVKPIKKVSFDEKNDLFCLKQIDEIKNTMSNKVTIASDIKSVQHAKETLAAIEQKIIPYQNELSEIKVTLKNTLLVAQEIVKSRLSELEKRMRTNVITNKKNIGLQKNCN